MNLKRALVLGVGGGALVVWITTAATSMSPASAPITPLPSTRAMDNSGAALAAEIGRLHERLRPSATPLQTRNLFSYVEHNARANAARVAPAAPQSDLMSGESVAPPRPQLTLVGIAEDGPSDATVRTAILSGFGDVFLVKDGETVASRYRVVAVSPGGVELVDSVDQSTLRLTLR